MRYNKEVTKLRPLFTVLIFLCAYSFPLAAQSAGNIIGERFEEVEGRGLLIQTNPPRVKVFIDGRDYGLTPLTLNLNPGGYNVILSMEGYVERSFSVHVNDSSRLVVSIEMERQRGWARISVHKAPDSPADLPFEPHLSINSGSEVVYDLKPLISIPVGSNTIRARAFGWEDAVIGTTVSEGTVAAIDIYMKPAVFKLENATASRRRFNPLNPGNLGVTDYRFEVSAPGSGTLKITNSDGDVVFTKHFGRFNTWTQHVTWDGKDTEGNPLPQGTYTVLIEASAIPEFVQSEEGAPMETLSAKLSTEISYSVNIFPLSLESGIAGLTFAPLPHVLPAGSYQINAGVLYGTFGLPFNLNMRFSPLEKLEFATVFNVNLYLEKEAGWGVSGSAKYNIIDSASASLPFSFSTGVSFAWANSNGEYPLSPGKGAGFYTPISYKLSNFSIIFCPAAFWHGYEGFVPEVLLSAGVLYHGQWLTGGLSARYESGFKEETDFRFLTGAEAHFLPPPSIFIISLKGGVLFTEQKIGGYGGIGFGIIY